MLHLDKVWRTEDLRRNKAENHLFIAMKHHFRKGRLTGCSDVLGESFHDVFCESGIRCVTEPREIGQIRIGCGRERWIDRVIGEVFRFDDVSNSQQQKSEEDGQRDFQKRSNRCSFRQHDVFPQEKDVMSPNASPSAASLNVRHI